MDSMNAFSIFVDRIVYWYNSFIGAEILNT